jgi:hypothetical protein
MTSIPSGWRLVPSRSRQQEPSLQAKSKRTILSYENVYTGERFTDTPTTPATPDLPSELFENHVILVGEYLLDQQAYQMGCLLKDSKILHQRQQNSTYVVHVEELSNESASLVGSALSRRKDETGDFFQTRRVGETLYSETYQAELLTYSDIICKIVKNSISQIEIVHGRQVQLLQDAVDESSSIWHSGGSIAQLHQHWEEAKLHVLNAMEFEVTGGRNASTVNKGGKGGKSGKGGTTMSFTTSLITPSKKQRRRGRRRTMIGQQLVPVLPPFEFEKDELNASSLHLLSSPLMRLLSAKETTTQRHPPDHNLRPSKNINERRHQAWNDETFHKSHTIKIQDQLEIVYQARHQKQLVEKVKNEFGILRTLVKKSRKRRLNVDADNQMYEEDENTLEDRLEEEEEEAEHDVEYLKKEMQYARQQLMETTSEAKSLEEKLNSIRQSVTTLSHAYQLWDGISSLHETHVLAPHIRQEVGYKSLNGTNGTSSDTILNRNKAGGALLSRIISIARRKNLATYIATGGDGKSNDNDDHIHEKLRKARQIKGSETKSAQMAAMTGFESPSMKRMFMLSLAYEVGGGQSFSDSQNQNAPLASDEKKSVNFNQEFGGVNQDPRFKRMQADRCRTMMRMLNSHRVPSYTLTKFKAILDEHEMAMANAANSQNSLQDSPDQHISDVNSRLLPLQEDYENKLRSLSSQHDLHPQIVQQVLIADREAMKPHLLPALRQVIRVVRAMQKFAPPSNKNRHSSDSTKDHAINEFSNFDHDHRLQRIHNKSTQRLANIFKQHRVRANIANLLQAATHEHHRVVEDLLLRQAGDNENSEHSNKSEVLRRDTSFAKRVHDASLQHQKTLLQIQKHHFLPKALIDDLATSHDLHHVHIMHGDSDADSENDDNAFDDF